MRLVPEFSIFSLSITFCIIANTVNSYNILGVNFSPIQSHYNFSYALMKGLADDGNDVVFISPVKSSNPIKNLREIHIDLSDYERGNYAATVNLMQRLML